METFIMSAYTKSGFFTKLVGVTFDNEDGSSRQQCIAELDETFDISKKTFLTAKRDTNNQYDDKAVAIFDDKGRQLGYLSRKVNETVAPWMDEGFDLVVEIVNVTGGDGSHWGLNIWVEKKKKSA
jgi:hypothetical protein